jgi:outer membrane receptor protein involved in Fe transport
MLRSSLLTVLLLAIVVAAYAGTTGNLSGIVKDEDGKILDNVHIVLYQNAVVRAVTDNRPDGTFSIINLPPGVYDLQAKRISYASRNYKSMQIIEDETTRLEIVLGSQGTLLPTVTVSAEKKLKVNPESGLRQTADDIANTPVSSINDLVSRQAGVINTGDGTIHVRGSRANETVYNVDGMTVTDAVYGGSPLTVDLDAVQSINTIIGGLPAEYGNAQAGVFNIITKDGSEFFSGKLEASSDHLVNDGSNDDNIKFLFSGPVMFWLGNNDRDRELKNKLTFFFNATGDWYDGRYHDLYGGDPDDLFNYDNRNLLVGKTYDAYDQYAGRDDVLGFDVGNRNYNSYTYNFKTTYQYDKRRKVTIAVRGDRDYFEPFAYSWRYAINHYAQVENRQQQYLATFDYNFGELNNMNLKVKANYFRRASKQSARGIDKSDFFVQTSDPDMWDPDNGLYGFYQIDANNDGILDSAPDPNGWNYSIQGIQDTKAVEGFVTPGSIYPNTYDDLTENYQFRTDYEYKANDVHTFKTGVELIQHHIKQDHLSSAWQYDPARFDLYLKGLYQGVKGDSVVGTYTDPSGNEHPYAVVYYSGGALDSVRYNFSAGETNPTGINYYNPNAYYKSAWASSGNYDGYDASPFQAAYYLQDKLEIEGLLVNFGLRLDLWYLGDDYTIYNTDGSSVKQKFSATDKTQLMVSPRLGISHPISTRDVIHFTYNYQNQLPQMQYIFTSASVLDAYENPTGVVLGNPSLDPQITITYEAGLQHRFNDTWTMDMTAYYKNIYNYVSTAKMTIEDPTLGEFQAYQYVSENYGSAKGIDLNLSKEMSYYLTGSASYSVAWANGNNSAEGAVEEANNNLREYPLDWDIRHNFNFNLTFDVEKNQDFRIPLIGETYLGKLGSFTTSFQYTISSGLPYTPQDEDASSLSPEINSKRMDYTDEAALRFQKEFELKSHAQQGRSSSLVRVYMDINNLFNKHNIEAVFAKTGEVYDDGADLTEGSDNIIYPERVFMHNLALRDPGRLSNGRTFTVGVSYNW